MRALAFNAHEAPTMSVPPGAELTDLELIAALKWKLREIISPPQSDTPLNEVLEYERRLRRKFKYLSLMEYNSTIPINVLPPEILTRIFSFVPLFQWQHYHQFPPLFLAETSLHDRNSWISSTTHVCSHWRNVAISDPSLWNHMAGVRFAGRAGTLPLHVHQIVQEARGSNKGSLIGSSAFLKLVKRRSLGPQLTSYHISGSRYLPGNFWDLLAKIDAPNLESLALDMPLEDEYDQGYHRNILPRIFSGLTPLLKRLSLENIEFWPHNTFRNLTHLSLKYPWYADGCRAPIAHLFDILTTSPMLVFLRLIAANFIVSNPGAYTTAPLISLPTLRIFEMGEFDSFLPRILLSHIVIPETCVVYVWHHGMTEEGMYEDDFGFLSRHSTFAHITVDDLSLAAPLRGISRAVIHDFGVIVPLPPSITFCDKTIHFVREGFWEDPLPLNDLDDILCGVTSLYIKGTNLNRWRFQPFVQRMPALEVVSFVGGKDGLGDFPVAGDLRHIVKVIREWAGPRIDDQVGEPSGKSLTAINIPSLSFPEYLVETAGLDDDALQLYRNGSVTFARNGLPPCIVSVDTRSHSSEFLNHPLPDYPGAGYIFYDY